MSSILTKLSQYQPRDSIKILDSTLVDHSISLIDYSITELLNVLHQVVELMLTNRDLITHIEERLNSGTSMVFQRQSRMLNIQSTHLKSNQMVVVPMLDASLPTQDGGRCGDTTTVE